MTRIVRRLSLLALAAAAACSDSTGPQQSRAAVAGAYFLASVNGEALPSSDPYAPISGTISLWPTGHAERRISYRLSDGRTQSDVATGTFVVEDGRVILALRYEQGNYPWTVTADVDGSTLTMSYPGPADGTIVERYRRL